MQTVDYVDLKRYQGEWYEIARLPLYWENNCASDVTANYTLQPGGKIEVLNTCRKADGTLTRSRGACLLPLSPLVALVRSASLSSALAATIAFAHLSWMITLTAIAVDLFPKAKLGTAFGYISAGSGIGGLISAEVIPHILQASGYLPLFIVMGFLHPLALLMIWRLRDKVPALPLVRQTI